MQGWVSLHRKVLDNPIVCKDGDYFSIWCYLLLNATHDHYDVEFKGKRITLEPGQLITGRKSISSQFSINESKVQRVLKKLEIEHQIEQQTSNKKRLVTVLNWSSYQGSEQQNEQQLNNKRTTTEQQVNTNNNVITKKQNNDNKNKKTSVNYQEIVDEYNSICIDLSKCIKVSEARKRTIKSFLTEFSRDDLTTVFEKAQSSNFLTGKDNKWKASFDWLLNKTNALKVIEGNYDNKGTGNKAMDIAKSWFESEVDDD